MQCQVGLYFLSNSFLMYAAISFSMLYFSRAFKRKEEGKKSETEGFFQRSFYSIEFRGRTYADSLNTDTLGTEKHVSDSSSWYQKAFRRVSCSQVIGFSFLQKGPWTSPHTLRKHTAPPLPSKLKDETIGRHSTCTFLRSSRTHHTT